MKTSIDDPLVKDEDWRLQVCTRVLGIKTRDRGLKTRVGDPLKAVANIQIDHTVFQVGIPNATAIYLNISFKHYEAAKLLYANCNVKGAAAETKYIPDELMFDFFEAIMTSIIFAYSALEAFANEEIPEGFYFEKKYKQIWTSLGKTTIEREVDLGTKLKKIIPEVHKIKSVAGTSLWQEFLTLEEIRDRLIHLKTIDRHAPVGETNSIWHKLFSKPLICPCDISKRIIMYHYKVMKNQPRWIKLVAF